MQTDSSTRHHLWRHPNPGPLTGRTLDELMKELEHKWNSNVVLTPVEHELLHRWRVGRLAEAVTPE